eukprot:TRINITY_DN18724_c0_g1_i1.p3 TRINITY_DN18724_c0_g1~~TRINITY_DN18724_c0_g1_i1.p3  ORF type:complete len:231 (-),score=38.88 TRINITY_DN18724_c0_g1_i1:74-766(-)
MEQDQQSWNQNIQSLQQQNQQLIQQLEQNQALLHNNNKQSNQFEDQSDIIFKLENDLRQTQQQLENCKNQYSDNLMYYDDQLQELTEQNQRLQKQLQNSSDQVPQNGRSSFQFDLVQDEVQKYHMLIDEKDRHIEQIERCYQEVSQENQQQKGDKLQLQMQIDDWQDKYRRDLKQSKEMEEEFKQVKIQLTETQQKLYLAEGYVAVNQQLNQQIEQMNFQLTQLRENQQI